MTDLARVTLVLVTIWSVQGNYLPSWESLDKRPLPEWYDEAKVGIFIHWGVFSVPSFGSEWFWHHWKNSSFPKYANFMRNNYPPDFTYQDFGKDFTAEFFDPHRWANIFKNSGARYVVLTSKHHEGFTLWPSKYSSGWNAQDIGPHRDLVGELAQAIRSSTDLKFGLYHSLFEWFNPLWLEDWKNNFTTNNFVKLKIQPEIKELVMRYKPEVLWSDGQAGASDEYWGATKFLAWLYNSSPVKSTVVSNDRWGRGVMCKHGVVQPHKWENALTLDKKSWGFRREASAEDFLTFKELIQQLVSTVSCGGNILINVGPTKDGVITPIYEERLRQLGDWLKVNGEAIYSSRPWTFQNETVQTGVWYTESRGNVYATFLEWPKANLLTLHRPYVGSTNKVSILGNEGSVKWQTAGVGLNIRLPDMSRVKSPLPWVIKMTDIRN